MEIALTIGIAVTMALLGLVAVGVTLLGLSGVWVVLLAAIGLELWRDTYSTQLLIVAGVLALGGEVIEFTASAAMAKRAGGSKVAAWWSVFGGLAGAILGSFLIPIPIVGTIAGAVIGAGVGATLGHRRTPDMPWRDAARVGRAAASGRLLAIAVKTVIAAIVSIALVVGVVV
ncbi:MAG: DUF456 domain-containing protein [Phycisphaerales bacterium]